MADNIARLISTRGNSVSYYDFAHTPQMSSNHILYLNFNVCIVGLAMCIKSNSLSLHNCFVKCKVRVCIGKRPMPNSNLYVAGCIHQGPA